LPASTCGKAHIYQLDTLALLSELQRSNVAVI
jgi:hypothetical protein